MNPQATPTFKMPFLQVIEKHLSNAVSISWEGCHKIYIELDQASHDRQVKYGYEPVMVEDKQDALNELYEWFDRSCGLRFIHAIKNRNIFFFSSPI